MEPKFVPSGIGEDLGHDAYLWERLHSYLQGPAKEWFPGCENFSGKAREKW